MSPLRLFFGPGLYGAGCIIIGAGLQASAIGRVAYGLTVTALGLVIVWPMRR